MFVVGIISFLENIDSNIVMNTKCVQDSSVPKRYSTAIDFQFYCCCENQYRFLSIDYRIQTGHIQISDGIVKLFHLVLHISFGCCVSMEQCIEMWIIKQWVKVCVFVCMHPCATYYETSQSIEHKQLWIHATATVGLGLGIYWRNGTESNVIGAHSDTKRSNGNNNNNTKIYYHKRKENISDLALHTKMLRLWKWTNPFWRNSFQKLVRDTIWKRFDVEFIQNHTQF